MPPPANPVAAAAGARSDDQLLSELYQLLRRQGMKGAPRKTIWQAAKALLHVSRGGVLDYHFVSAHYGYSPTGATKFIIALQKRGLLERRGGRQLFLTEKGQEHLRQAAEGG